MGNRFIAALSSRFSSSPRTEQSDAAGSSATQASEPEDCVATNSGETAGEADADALTLVRERKADVAGPSSSWQLVAPGYEFTGGTLRAKARAPGAAARDPSNGTSAAPSQTLPSGPAVELQKQALPLGIRRPWGLLGVGLSAGCAMALLGLRVGDADAEHEPSRVAPVMASTQEPCPLPVPLQSLVNFAPSNSVLPLSPMVIPAVAGPAAVVGPAVVSELADAATLADSSSDEPAPAAELTVDEPAVDAPPAMWRPKSRTNTQTKTAKTRIEMETRQVMVSGRAVAAVIILKRTGSKRGRARVRWKTLPGTATPAKDYEGTSTTVQFADGQTQRTIFVPILQQQSQGAESRTFSVVLERAPRGSALGSVTSTTVTILGDG